MQVDGIRVAPEGDRVRLIAEIRYDRGTPERESCWFEVPADLEPELSSSGNPWLACLLPLAIHLGEPLQLAAPVDPVLLEGARDLISVWCSWYPRLAPIPVEAPLRFTSPCSRAAFREACFFSGGADSSFTALQRIRSLAMLPPECRTPGSLELLYIHGLDNRLDRDTALSRVSASARRVVDAYGCGLVLVSTNLRQTRLRGVPWGRLAHGGVLAGTALALENRYCRALISSSFDYADPHPWGSHPLTDPLLSTSSLRMEHYGCRYRRAEKVAALASPDADPLLRGLRVCYHNQDGTNCGACRKCYRAMAVLEMMGALERCELFPPGAYTVKRLGRCYTPVTSRSLLNSIRDLARERGRLDVARACEQSWRVSRTVQPLVQFSVWLRDHPRHSLTGKRLRRLLAAHLVL